MSDPPDTETIRTFLRSRDPDHYLTALFAPRHARIALTALYAFNAELARIPDLVSEPTLGEIRLQWWRDAVGTLESGGVTGNPLADALGQAMQSHALPKPLLQGIIDARSADLEGGGFEDLQALKAYFYKTEGALFALSARILGGSDAQTGRTTNSAGVAYGLARRLCAIPQDAAEGRVMLPLTVLNENALEPEQLLAGKGEPQVRQVIEALAGEARDALALARAGLSEMDPLLRPAFAPLGLVAPYLAVLSRVSHNPLHDIAGINPLYRFLALWRAGRRGPA
jgi:phytoene synthase